MAFTDIGEGGGCRPFKITSRAITETHPVHHVWQQIPVNWPVNGLFLFLHSWTRVTTTVLSKQMTNICPCLFATRYEANITDKRKRSNSLRQSSKRVHYYWFSFLRLPLGFRSHDSDTVCCYIVQNPLAFVCSAQCTVIAVFSPF